MSGAKNIVSRPPVTKCAVVSFLQKIVSEANSHDPNLAGAAQHALAILQDINLEEITPIDLDCLRALLEAIDQEWTDSLLATLLKVDPDCPVCAALKRALGICSQQNLIADSV